MYNINFRKNPTNSFLNCSNKKDYEFLYNMFSAKIYEAVYPIVESEKIAEQILTDTFINIRKQEFAYHLNYTGIFTILLRMAIQLSYNECKVSNPKKIVYQKLGKNFELLANQNSSKIKIAEAVQELVIF
jgi:hypothetical protein